jgi:hypothetical protein
MWSSYLHKNEEAICSMFTRARQYTHGECLATCGRVSDSTKKRDKTTKQTHVKLDELIQFIFLGTEASSSNIRRVQILQKDSSGPR